jgi:hypothetical protein
VEHRGEEGFRCSFGLRLNDFEGGGVGVGGDGVLVCGHLDVIFESEGNEFGDNLRIERVVGGKNDFAFSV